MGRRFRELFQELGSLFDVLEAQVWQRADRAEREEERDKKLLLSRLSDTLFPALLLLFLVGRYQRVAVVFEEAARSVQCDVVDCTLVLLSLRQAGGKVVVWVGAQLWVVDHRVVVVVVFDRLRFDLPVVVFDALHQYKVVVDGLHIARKPRVCPHVEHHVRHAPLWGRALGAPACHCERRVCCQLS
eukprot:7377437-Prymnesium_polylepis.1